MFRSALFPLPMLVALAACTPAADSGDAAATSESAASADADTGMPAQSDPADASASQAPDPADVASSEASGTGDADAAAQDPTIVAGPGLDESCDASAVQDVVGKMSEQALVDDAVRRSGAKTVRVIPHDGMVTMDYRGDRLNLQLDEAGKIVAATCG